MAKPSRVLLASAILLGLAAPAVLAPARAADLALKRVVLSTGGVGYFEYEAAVQGDATLALEVPLDQVDDVLKSLVVYDSGGSAGAITLPGRAPLSQSFADLPFDRAALNSLTDLLNALQGAEIRVDAPQAISGRLLHVDPEQVHGAGGTVETRSRVSVMTDAGLRQFVLQDSGAITFVDPQLQRQVDTALSRLAAYRAAGRRQLQLQVHGKGGRSVRVGYVVAVPLWKASYRLSLPADAKAAGARLQGWAVLENFSGRAWHDVELTLLSGNPVTFRQALYESYYVPRPTVPVESGGHVLPPPDAGAIGNAVAFDAVREQKAAGKAMPLARREASNMAMAAPAAAPAAPPPAPTEAAAAEEEATQTVFTAPDKVNVPAGQSLVLPLLDRELPARRVDLYQPAINLRHPLAAVELTNDGDTGLPPGVLTLYRQNPERGASYLGDARLSALPAGDKRLLSYAVDNKVTVDRSSEERRPLVKATVARGVMQVHRLVRWATTYRVKATATGAPPQLLIEQPRRSGAPLTQPDPKSVELTAAAYRIPFALPAGGAGSLTVVEEQPVEETIRVLDLDDNRLGALVSSPELAPKLRQALSDIAGRRQALAGRRGDLARMRDQRSRLVEDERRLRDNLAAVGADPALHKRLLDKFSETEAAIDAVTADIAKTDEAVDAAERDLAGYVAGLTLP
jgi:hypothetical protein